MVHRCQVLRASRPAYSGAWQRQEQVPIICVTSVHPQAVLHASGVSYGWPALTRPLRNVSRRRDSASILIVVPVRKHRLPGANQSPKLDFNQYFQRSLVGSCG